MDSSIAPALYIVPTPIGNLEDITFRAVRILKECDIIACEDTRTASKLLKLLNIEPKTLVSYFEHNERARAGELVDKIQNGKSVALISEAGTPIISDPGWAVVQEAIAREIHIVSLPGASAFLTAIVASGIAADKFAFFGFPPHKKGRKTFLQKIAELDITAVLYESPYRIHKLLDELSEMVAAERKICLARELTKIYEEYIRGSIEEVKEKIKNKSNLKGEFVVILEGKK
ncbi:MAG TPA: 16S rRNA (cytidine(1402)-2'-O)-methyltransferase [Candidatus Kapabacteria bacterium]|jgi:16S rRNA (cytidine1402-2'-O)-methyltransferase|nr:16S rRNA (cytidine(1402)-2'-O)-methyltransferase [Candidatus Kapabacteria bacterium]HOM03975.1 16S rRNA (cytidine(1402)-2'-O)-methyltransferase [Candidatus Kapabacteria bacterium]